MHLLTKSFQLRSTHRLLSNPSWKFIRFQEYCTNTQNITMKVIKAPPITTKTYINKNEDLKRALSPHLSIYKPQITSMMSITLRMTGLALGLMAWVVGLTAFYSDQNVNYFVEELKKLDLNDYYWTGTKIIIVFPFAFHFVAGIRHLLFDTSKYMEKTQFYASGYAAIALSCILAVCLGVMGNLSNNMDEVKNPELSGKSEK